MAYLQVGAVPKKTVSAEGFGYWSPDLPTTDGAQIDLSLWVRAKNIKAAKENGGLYALAEFHNETGQNVSRQHLLGAGDGQKAVGAEWMTGDFKHKRLTGRATAPKGARWFKLGFGLRNCTGWASFNDIDIKTRPGTPETEGTKAPPIDARKFTWTPCDLTGLLNRPLADDVKYDPALGLILPATTVPSPEFVHVTVWMLLWKNPRPDKEISALEVKGAKEGVAGLIGLSRGVAK
jgi:hypothetical protein